MVSLSKIGLFLCPILCGDVLGVNVLEYSLNTNQGREGTYAHQCHNWRTLICSDVPGMFKGSTSEVPLLHFAQ